MAMKSKRLDDCYLYALTPPRVNDETFYLKKVEASLEGGVDLLQLRLKEGTDRQKLVLGQKIQEITQARGVPLIINDRLDLCQILEADGLHLGQDDLPLEGARKILGPSKIIGLSTHTTAEAYKAQAAGADYIGFGPCYPTSTKKDLAPQITLEEITELRQNLTIPFFVLGGLSLLNLSPILQAGANRAAISADIYQAEDVEERTRQIHRLLDHFLTIPA